MRDALKVAGIVACWLVLALVEGCTGHDLAPACLYDDGTMPAGASTCTWNDGTGDPFVASVPDSDGVATVFDYTWNGVSPVYEAQA